MWTIHTSFGFCFDERLDNVERRKLGIPAFTYALLYQIKYSFNLPTRDTLINNLELELLHFVYIFRLSS